MKFLREQIFNFQVTAKPKNIKRIFNPREHRINLNDYLKQNYLPVYWGCAMSSKLKRKIYSHYHTDLKCNTIYTLN